MLMVYEGKFYFRLVTKTPNMFRRIPEGPKNEDHTRVNLENFCILGNLKRVSMFNSYFC